MRTGLLSILLLLLLQPASGGKSFSALICDLKGKAEWKSSRESTWQSATILAQLDEGSEVKLEPGTTMTVNFVRGGTQATLLGPCRARLDEGALDLLEGRPESLSVRRPQKRTGILPPKGINLNRMGGLVRPKSSGQPRWTTDAVILPGKTLLTWQTSPEYHLYEVELTSDLDGLTKLLEKTEKGQLEAEVEADTTYLVTLRAFASDDPSPDFTWSGTLETLSRASSESLSEHSGETVADKVVRLTNLINNELYGPALNLCLELSNERPDDPQIQSLVESLSSTRAARGL